MMEAWIPSLIVITVAVAGFVGGYAVAARRRKPPVEIPQNIQTMLDAITRQWERQRARADRFRALCMRVAQWDGLVLHVGDQEYQESRNRDDDLHVLREKIREAIAADIDDYTEEA